MGNMHDYKSNLHVMEAEVLSSYSKQADNNIHVSVKMPNYYDRQTAALMLNAIL